MATYKLTYFNGRGRAEVARIMCKVKDIDIDDVRVEFGEQWNSLKPKTPFGQLPQLETGGITLCQSTAIERLFAKRLGFYGKDDLAQAKADMVVACGDDMLKAMIKVTEVPETEKAAYLKKCEDEILPTMFGNLEKMISPTGLFLEENIMWPDICIAHLLTFLNVYGISVDLSKFSKLSALKQRVETEPKIADWIKTRPETGF